jgi:hypothetical protein
MFFQSDGEPEVAVVLPALFFGDGLWVALPADLTTPPPNGGHIL